MRTLAGLVVGCGLLLAPGSPERARPRVPAPRPPPDTVTFTRDVAPILFERCAACHRPGGPGPFSVLDFEEVGPRAERIAEVTVARRMPPWLPSPASLPLEGERRLTDEEIRTIAAWVEAGAPEGDPGDLPPLPPAGPAWPLGEPDLVVRAPEIEVPAGGEDRYRNLVLPVPPGGSRWVRAVDLRAGDPRVVHHARLMLDTTAASRALDASDAEPGFDGMQMVPGARNPPGHFVGWTPGRTPRPGPPGLAWPLPAGADLVLQLHLRPDTEPRTVAAEVGLYLAERPPTSGAALVLLGTEIIDIPPGATRHEVRDRYRLPVAARLLSVYPHAHYLARTMLALAHLPDGGTEVILEIPEWDFDWQDEYRLATPLALPAGTVLEMRYTYDNSAANPRNPARPPRRVRYGSRSTDEMADLILQLVTDDPADAAALEADLARKYEQARIDYLAWAEAQAGHEAAAAGDPATALRHYQASLRNRDDPRILLAMSDVLLALGERATARLALERSLQLARGADDPALVAELESRLALLAPRD